jgi:hypothetical protein
VWGWAWADGGARSVLVRADDAATWRSAEVEPPRGREWQRFSMLCLPEGRGPVVLASLAETTSGVVLPMSGRRNAVHQVPVTVV